MQMVKVGRRVARKVLLVLHQGVPRLVGVLMVALWVLQMQLEVQGEKKDVVHWAFHEKGLMKEKAEAGQKGQV